MPEAIMMLIGLAGMLMLFVMAACTLAWLRGRHGVLLALLVVFCAVIGLGMMVSLASYREHTVRQHTMDRLRALGNQMHSAHQQQVEAEYRALEAEHQHAISGSVKINGEDAQQGTVELTPDTDHSPIEIGSDDHAARNPAPNLPDWVKRGVVRIGDNEFLVISSSQHADLADATTEAEGRAAQSIAMNFRGYYPEVYNWPLPAKWIRSAVRERHVEELQHDFGRFTGTMYRVYLQIELSPPLRSQIHADWSHQMGLQRLWTMSAGVGAMTVLLAGAAGCFRLFGRSPQMRLNTHYA